MKQIQVSFEEKEIGKIDEYAKKLRVSRSNFVRNLVLEGLKDVKVLDRLGVVGVVGLMRSVSDSGDLGDCQASMG